MSYSSFLAIVTLLVPEELFNCLQSNLYLGFITSELKQVPKNFKKKELHA